MGNVWPEDNWKVHFRDTMRGGKMLNNWRMAQLHAQEAPDRIYELERWGALFDRTKDGRILQRDFGGHRYARLAHVGDRTGLELIRTLQQRAIALDIDVFMECKILRLLKGADGTVTTAVGYWRPSGEIVSFTGKAFVLATGSIGKSWLYTSNSWESTGDGHAMAAWAGADMIDMEACSSTRPGWCGRLSVRGILVTEGVRGDGGVLRNSEGRRFMFDYIPPMFAAETADTEEEGDRWYEDHINNRRPPELLPRDEVARSINSEVKAGRGSRTAGCSSTSPRGAAPSTSGGGCRRCTTSSWSWPAWTSPPSPWRWGRRVTTSWAASASMPTPRRRPCPGSSPRARWPAACTAPTGSGATRSRTSSCSGAGPAWPRRTTPQGAPARRRRSRPRSPPWWPRRRRRSGVTAVRAPTTSSTTSSR